MSRNMTDFEQYVGEWCVECFGKTTADDVSERNWRFLEEALELVQALGGEASDAHNLVDYVFARKPGVPEQEVGGVMVTLAALTFARRLNLARCAVRELGRILEPETMEKIRAKHRTKPHRSPLPGDFETLRQKDCDG